MKDSVTFQVVVKTPLYAIEAETFGDYDSARNCAFAQMGVVVSHMGPDGALATVTMIDKNARDQYRETILMQFNGEFFLRREQAKNGNYVATVGAP